VFFLKYLNQNDDVSLTSSVARTGVSTNNKVTADLDATAIKVSYAF